VGTPPQKGRTIAASANLRVGRSNRGVGRGDDATDARASTQASLSLNEQKACYRSVNTVAREAIRKGGRATKRDLFGQPGGFVPHVCSATLGKPCPECGTAIVKFVFEGGSCYVCPKCQTE